MEIQIVKTLYVVFVNDHPKGLLTETEFKSFNQPWWNSFQEISVPQEDWDKGTITISSIQKYLRT